MTNPEETSYSPAERRRNVRTIKRLLNANLIALIVAIVALILAGIALTERLMLLQQSRVRAATDTCQLLRTIVLAATPAQRKKIAVAFINREGIANCQRYGRDITRVK